MPKYYESLELNHAETLLDVVFGVVIGLALIELPSLILIAAEQITATNLIAPILLVSALLFSAFYWLEVRHFLHAQSSFNKALKEEERLRDDAVPLPLALFLIGSLAMMTLATAMLVYAVAGNFSAFVIAAFLFWVCDFAGTLSLKQAYRPYKKAIEEIQKDHEVDHRWFIGHIVSRFFIFYGALNAAIFALLIVFDLITQHSESFRLSAAVAILIVTIFRHLAWRSRIYSWWTQKHVFPESSAS